MDPSISKHLVTKVMETGDYKWRDTLLPGLSEAISKRIDKWVTTDPPYCYDPAKDSALEGVTTSHNALGQIGNGDTFWATSVQRVCRHLHWVNKR